MKELRIGNLILDNPFFLAPLAGITDAPMRKLCKEQGAALVFTEMVSAKGLWYGDKNTGRLLYTDKSERPVGVQIFGHEPEVMAYTAREMDKIQCDLIDINMGCPVPKIVKNGEGSALLKNPDLIYDLVSAVVKNTSKPVTVKIRIGWDSESINAVEVAHAISAAGASAISVHGRTREQYYSGKADWSVIAKVKRAVNIPVVGNGDVIDGASAIAIMEQTGCDFVMIGRGALGNPWIFRELIQYEETGRMIERPSLHEIKEMMLRHARLQIEQKGVYLGIREMRKHVAWYTTGLPNSAKMRDEINRVESMEELEELLKKRFL